MGQQLLKVNFDPFDVKDNDGIRSCNEKDRISFLFPWRSDSKEKISIKQIRMDLFQLTNGRNLDEEINEILREVFVSLENNSNKPMKHLTKPKEYPSITKTLSHVALQSLISILLILIQSVEKSNPQILHQIFSITNELIEQMPIKSFSSSDLFLSLKPLIRFLEDLSLSSDLILAKKSIEILLNLFMAKASFNDLLPLLARLTFDTENIYDLHNLIRQLNNNFTENQLTGQLISSMIFSYIQSNDFFEFQFDHKTLKHLFNIIERIIPMKTTNECLDSIFLISIQFFGKYFEDLFQHIDQEELNKYLQVFSSLSKNEEREKICSESSKIFIFILDLQSQSFDENLSFISQLIKENPSEILFDEILLHLKNDIFIVNWIENLPKENSVKILFVLIEIYLQRNDERIEQILLSFQQTWICKFIEQSKKQINAAISPMIEYLRYIFANSPKETELIKQILIGLSLMVKPDEQIFPFDIVEPIFIALLPILSEYLEKNRTNYSDLINWLLGRMCSMLIIGSPLDSFEEKYSEELHSPLFNGGYQSIDLDSSPDQQLLMSIYYNRDEGAKLLSRMKFSLKKQEISLQKSISDAANDACISLFAVYIKYFHRIALVRLELSRSDTEKVNPHLLSLYKSANHVRTLFADLKGQGGDCQLFHQQIKSKSLFLLSSIKETDLPATKDKFDPEGILHQSIEHFLLQGNHLVLEQFHQAIDRQNQRAFTRLSTYRFLCKLNLSNIFFSQLITSNINCSYLQNIPTANEEIKHQIIEYFYLIIRNVFSSPEILFNLLNISLDAKDISYLFDYQIIDDLFRSLVSFERMIPLKWKFLSFYWFRSFTLQISERFAEKIPFVFNDFIFNQMKDLIELLTDQRNEEKDFLENLTIGWFVHVVTLENVNQLENNYQIELYLNQYLVLLYESIYLYEDVRSRCANLDYIELLLKIYYRCQSISTIFLTLKILGELISSLTNIYNEKSIEKFLNDTFISISENPNPLIEIFRLILSRKCSYQIHVIHLILHSITDLKQLDRCISGLTILGGYIQQFSLGTMVKVSNDETTRLAAIIQMKMSSSMMIYYLDNHQIELTNLDRLEIDDDRSTSLNLINLPNGNQLIEAILDKLAEFIQLENRSLPFLQIKRRSLSALFSLLNNQRIIEVFLDKPYASIIAKLAIDQSMDSSVFTKQSLERYSLTAKFSSRDENLVESLSTSMWKYNGWKPSVSKYEYQLLNHGRLGNNDMFIVSIPVNITKDEVLQECGNKHRFKGKISPNSANTNVRFPSFIVRDLRVKEGKWYFCVKLNVGGLVQIGWATDGFSPGGNKGIGDDLYSWSYDGSRDTLFHNQDYSRQFHTRWKANDTCGCGIDIQGELIQIKYWLNGIFLGVAFSHREQISKSANICNLLPNGSNTTFFPGITLQSYVTPSTSCQLIFSPEDMNECPLPMGYKPLLMPKLIQIENSIVAYPYSAYLIQQNPENYFYPSRTINSKRFLRDFVNQCHLITEFNLNEHYLCLSKESSGFPLSIDPNLSSFTITFDFQIEEEPIDLQLFTFDPPNDISIEISLEKNEENIRTVIIGHLKEQQIIVYTKSKSQIFDISIDSFNLHLLPKREAKLTHLALWKYDLSEEHIQRLFTYGLFYLDTDYQQRIYTFSFTEHRFDSELLIPFDQPFTDELWQSKKNQAEANESNYFHSSILQFYGNRTYLVLDKPKNSRSSYTLILEINIPQWPKENEQLSIVSFDPKVHLYVTHQGKLSLTDSQSTKESQSSVLLNEFIRLLISIEEKSIEISLNRSSQIEFSVTEIKFNRIDLFRQIDPTKTPPNDQTLRIECRSISFINENLHSFLSPSLIAIGYNPSWIKHIIEHDQIYHIQTIDTILREKREEFIQRDLDNQRTKYLQVFARLVPPEEMKNIEQQLMDSTIDLRQQIQSIVYHWNHFQTNNYSIEYDKHQWIRENISSNTNQVRRMIHLFDDESDIFRRLDQKDIQYKLIDLTKPTLMKILSKPDLNSSIDCEDALIRTYAQYIINNMINIWSNHSSQLFPLDKFGDYPLIIQLIQTMDSINSLLKSEIEQMDKTLLFHLQKNVFLQLIRLIVDPSSLSDLNSLLKMLNLFVDSFFPPSLINLLFDVFLFIPNDQSQIFILRLFSRLIQTNEQFLLNDQMHKYLLEFSSNSIAENDHLQIAVMDLVILQLIKRNDHLSQLPENIRQLIILMNFINGKILPEQFEDNRKKLTREDFDRSEKYFTRIIDQQLVDYISTTSFDEQSFIENLPNEFVPSSAAYEKYPLLANIPIELIQIRSEFLYQLNIFIVKLLPMIDLNFSPGESFLTDQIRSIKSYLFHQTKFELFELSLSKTTIEPDNTTLRVSFNLLNSNETTMFDQAYQQLSPHASRYFRTKDRQIWEAIYVGMHSIDQGGPYRDSITQICSDICSERLSLFILCPNGRTNTGLNQDCWIPNVYPPNQSLPDQVKKHYQFVGQLMGMAIRKKHYLDCKFPLLVWKQLLKETITMEDIQTIDLTISNQIEDIISELHFEVVASNGQTYQLIPGGRNSRNLKEYSSCYRQYRLNEFDRQIELIRQGLYSVVPFYFLSLFTPNQLEEAVCGKGQIDIDLLQRNTKYDQTEEENTPHIQRFWKVFTKLFNEEQRKLFLTFVWGRNTLPRRDQDFNMKFTINRYPLDDENVDTTLPRSHTCVFSIDLPQYSTIEIMYQRLNYAINYCSAIDGDGTFNEQTTTTNLIFNSDD